MLSKGSMLYNPVVDLCRQAGFVISDRMSSVLQMVKNGQVVAILMHPTQQKMV